jgi:hypothetical protein
MIRPLILAIILLLASKASAQPPVIDSMLIDESKGILSVYGSFGSAQGKVWCDSVELSVLSWSDSLVTATIPDTGKGSAGAVELSNSNGTSEKRMLTQWVSHIKFYSRHISGPRFDQTDADFYLNWRYDIHSVLKSANKNRMLAFPGMHTSYDFQRSVYSVFDTIKSLDSGSHNPLLYTVYFDVKSLQVDADIDVWVSIFWGMFAQPGFILDSNLSIASFEKKDPGDGTSFYYTKWDSSTPIFVPPAKAIALLNDPSIISPSDNGTDLGTNDILLQWDSLKYMDSYHIQLSKDSLVNGQHSGQTRQGFMYIVDTTVSSLDFQLPPLEKNTKYFWRVAGVNSEGESRWSEVWNFITGSNASAISSKEKNIPLWVSPNPVRDIVNFIVYLPAPASVTLGIYNALGEKIENIHSGLLNEGENSIGWDMGRYAEGMYFVLLESGGKRYLQKVIVTR